MGENAVTAVRRRDRSQGDDWIREFLRLAPYGFLAVPAEGGVHVNSNLFAYDAGADVIYMHTARVGRLAATAPAAGVGTFSAATMGRLLPAPEALEFSCEYAAVVAYGRVEVVEEEAGKARALQMILDKYAPHLRPGRDYRPMTDPELKRTAVYAIRVEAWSGKEKSAPADFPGAFAYPYPAPPILADEAEVGG